MNDASSTSSHVFDRLLARCRQTGSVVCAGLDPHLDQLPSSLDPGRDPVRACRLFLFPVIEALADVVPAVKPQIAFFEQMGPEGVALYFDVVRKAHSHGLFVIGDIKRADIGSTAAAYARAHLAAEDGSAADAVTLNPYLGVDSISPFLQIGRPRGRGVFVLARTSNPSAREFQDLICGSDPLYLKVGKALEGWGSTQIGESGFTDVGAVVGATGPDEGAEIRRQLPRTFFLVPGFGAQGGTATDVVRTFRIQGDGALISSSRGILFAYRNEPDREAPFAEAARAAAVEATVALRTALAQSLKDRRHTDASTGPSR